MLTYIFLTIIVVAFIAGYFAGKISKKNISFPAPTYIKGINYILNQKEDEALRELLGAIKKYPENVDIYILLGNLYRKRGEIEKAIRIHQTVLAHVDLNKEIKKIALYNLSKDFSKAGMYKRALEALDEIERVDKKYILCLQEKAKIYILMKNWISAIDYYKKISKISTDYRLENLSSLYVELARESLKESKFFKAKKYLNKALYLYSANAFALMTYGDYYLKKNNIAKAKEFYKKSVNENISFFVFIRVKLNKIGCNITEFLTDDSPIGIYFFTREFIKKNKIDEAIEYIKGKIKIFPEYDFLQRIYFLLLSIKENDTEKVKLMRKYIKLKFFCNLCNITMKKFLWQCPNCKNWLSFKFYI